MPIAAEPTCRRFRTSLYSARISFELVIQHDRRNQILRQRQLYYLPRAFFKSSCSKAVAIRSISVSPKPQRAACLRHFAMVSPTSLAIVFARDSSRSAGNLYRQRQRRRCVVFCDRRRQHTWFQVDRHRVEIVCRRKAPSRLSCVEEAVIAEMIVGIRDEDVEHQTPPKRLHILLRGSAVLAQCVFPDSFFARCLLLQACSLRKGRECAARITVRSRANCISWPLAPTRWCGLRGISWI